MASVGLRIHMLGVTFGRFCLVGRSQKFIQRRDRDVVEMRAVEKVSRSVCRVVWCKRAVILSVKRDFPEV